MNSNLQNFLVTGTLLIDNIKKHFAIFIASRRFRRELDTVQFNGFIGKSNSFLVLMPDNDEHFSEAGVVLKYLSDQHKNVCLFVRDFRVSLLPSREKLHYIEYGINDFNKFYLPGRRITEALKDRKYDVLLDLNLQENIYSSLAGIIADCVYRIGFKNGEQPGIFNFQLINNENNSAFSYRNLLNSLQMF